VKENGHTVLKKIQQRKEENQLVRTEAKMEIYCKSPEEAPPKNP